MPLVNVHMAEGRTQEQKRDLMEAITQAVVTHLGVTTASVRVWIEEFSEDHFMAGGELLSDRRARLAAGSAGDEDEDAVLGVVRG